MRVGLKKPDRVESLKFRARNDVAEAKRRQEQKLLT